MVKDADYGWGVGTGNAQETQGLLAAQFYKSVAKDDETGEAHLFDSGIQLVGHSLGGGLAGLVDSMYGARQKLIKFCAACIMIPCKRLAA